MVWSIHGRNCVPVVMCAGVSTAGYDDLLWLVIVPSFFFLNPFCFLWEEGTILD